MTVSSSIYNSVCARTRSTDWFSHDDKLKVQLNCVNYETAATTENIEIVIPLPTTSILKKRIFSNWALAISRATTMHQLAKSLRSLVGIRETSKFTPQIFHGDLTTGHAFGFLSSASTDGALYKFWQWLFASSSWYKLRSSLPSSFIIISRHFLGISGNGQPMARFWTQKIFLRSSRLILRCFVALKAEPILEPKSC